jgi:hypothetical protein
LPDARLAVGLERLTQFKALVASPRSWNTHPALELDVAEDPHVEIFETGAKEGVAAYVAVRATGADAACHAGPVMSESCRIEPRGHLVRPGRRGANAAAVMVEHGVLAGNSIRALIALLSSLLLAPVVAVNTPPLCRMRIGEICQPLTTSLTILLSPWK